MNLWDILNIRIKLKYNKINKNNNNNNNKVMIKMILIKKENLKY